MHEKYKEYVEEQHAPDELIQKTLGQMEQAQKKTPFHRTMPKRWGIVAAACICCILTIFGKNMFWTSDFMFHDMDKVEFTDNFGNATTAKKNITIEEYDSIMKTKVSKLKELPGWEMEGEECFVSYEDGLTWGTNAKEVISDGCRLVLVNENGKVTISVSEHNVVAPAALMTKKSSRYRGTELYLGYDGEQNIYYGAFSKKKCFYVVQAEGVEEEEMSAVLKEILKQIK